MDLYLLILIISGVLKFVAFQCSSCGNADSHCWSTFQLGFQAHWTTGLTHTSSPCSYKAQR